MTVSIEGAEPDVGRRAVPQGYAPKPGVYDEMLTADGAPRPSWRPLADWLANAAPRELEARAKRATRLLHDSFSEPNSALSEWRLDLAPLILAQDDWRAVAAIAEQRARLYTAILNDLYGAQRLFAQGVLPPDIIVGDPRFLRPMFGAPSEQNGLTMLALDIARGRDGAWRVIDAHAETSAGHGYAIANRMVTAEVAGDLFRRSGALKIGAFYQRLWDRLTARAGADDPRIALLSGGPATPGFNGHAYLARYFGFQRVEGSDLRVLDDRVYLKTTDGLKRIDLLLRGVEGRRSDPLELAPDGFDGPPGLAQAARAHPSLIANALGAALVENRAMSPFLAPISQMLLGEEPRAYDSPRLWLGERAVRDHVLQNLDDFVVYPAFEGLGRPGQAQEGRRSSRMGAAERAAFVEDLELRGASFVAEQPVGFATAPSWRPEGVRPASFALRVYVSIAGAGDAAEIDVMPGGVGLSIESDAAVNLSVRDAYSHDVWVVGAGGGTPLSQTRIVSGAAPHRVERGIQSRIADDLFWLGRYAERADAILRIVRQSLMQSASDLSYMRDLSRPSRALTHLLAKDEPLDQAQARSLAEAVTALALGEDRAHGLARTLAHLRGVAARNRDALSSDTWRALRLLTTDALQPAAATPERLRPDAAERDAPPPNAAEIVDGCDTLLTTLSALNGLTHENMTQDRGWLFLDLGRRIERSVRLAELLHELFATPEDADLERDNLTFALGVADSALGYRKRYRFAPEFALVMDLVLIEETNPRSLAHQLAATEAHIAALPKSADDAARSPEQRLALDLLTRVRLFDCAALAGPDAAAARQQLAKLLKSVFSETPYLSETISRRYFSLADEAPRRLGAIRAI